MKAAAVKLSTIRSQRYLYLNAGAYLGQVDGVDADELVAAAEQRVANAKRRLALAKQRRREAQRRARRLIERGEIVPLEP